MEVEFESRPFRPESLIWSEDNILALVTPAVLHIFTPSLGGALNQSSTKFLTTSTPALTLEQDNPPWRLMLNVASLRNAISPQAIEYVTATWSPTGCSRLKGCMLACITLRHSVFVYIPTSSHADRQWKKHVVLDSYLMSYWGAEPEIDLEMADKIESVSLAWSPKISVDDIGSVLALGNKAGDITIWHVTDPDNVRCVKSWKSSGNNWIVRMSWSPWISEGDRYISMLAYATADGAVCVSRVKFNASRPLDDIEVSENIMDTSHQTLHPCTVLRWSQTTAENANRPNMLAFSRGNRLNIWLPESNKTFVWRKPMAKAISDISWDTFGKKVFVFFMDGKHSVLCLEDDGLVADDECIEFVYQGIISRCHMQSKSNISQDEGDTENVNAEDDGDEDAGGSMANSKLQLHIISGNRSAEGLHLATVYFVTCPFLMEFQRERYQSCTLVLSNAHKDMRGDITKTLFSRLETFIHLPGAFITRNPAYYLYDILVLLGGIASEDGDDLEAVQKLFNVMNTRVNPIQDNIQTLAKREAMKGLPASLEARMEHAIFNSTIINADRVSVYLWSQLQKCAISSEFKSQLEKHSAAAVARIKRHGVRSILELFVDAATSAPPSQPNPVGDMKECDKTLLLLLCDSILLFHNDDKELLAIAEKTYSILQDQSNGQCDIVEQIAMLQDLKNGEVPMGHSFSSRRESCPACDAEIELESDISATCANGHTWQRCSVTLLLIADFHPRTCLGCRRKTLMVPDAKANASFLAGSKAASWLEVALRANSVCGFCGERYHMALRRKGT